MHVGGARHVGVRAQLSPVCWLAAALLGIGSAIFHPESSRLARLASGGAHGFAQSLFQVGGNFGNSLAPLIAAFFILPRGQQSLAWFALLALAGIVLLTVVGRWYKNSGHGARKSGRSAVAASALPAGQVRRAIAVLIALIFSKFFYLSSITSYYIFYLMHRFALPTEKAQLCLFVFLASAAVGTFVGGPIGDRIGRKRVIWASILGVLPFTLALPYVGLTATIGLSILIGLVLSSAFSAIVVYAQELMPGRVGMVSGLFFGLAFGMAGIGAAVLGVLADWTSIQFVYRICSFLPLIGLLTAFLPDVRNDGRRGAPKGKLKNLDRRSSLACASMDGGTGACGRQPRSSATLIRYHRRIIVSGRHPGYCVNQWRQR